MADYLLTEAEVSDDDEPTLENIIDPITKEDVEFIYDSVSDDKIHFYHMINKRIILDEPHVSIIKRNVIRLRIESDSGSSYEEEEEQYTVPNLEYAEFPEDTKIIISERIRAIYGTDDHEWNDYKLPTCEVYDFPKQEVFIKRLLDTLYMATKDNETINRFLPLSKNYVGKFEDPHEFVDNPLTGEDDSNKIEQSKDCLFLNLLYALRHDKTGECSHTTEFNCQDEEML